jgi:hypothetical protein
MAARKKPVARKAAPKPAPSQRERFIEAARKAEASEDAAVFDRAFGRVVTAATRESRRKDRP